MQKGVKSRGMIITANQPVFLPWSGFFSKANRVDAMVLLDVVQYPQGRSWMARNRFKSDKGEMWLTVPVMKRGRGKQIIRDVEICNESDWQFKHVQGLRHQYARAPYRDDYLPIVESIITHNHARLVSLNLDLIRFLYNALGVGSRLVLQSELGITGKGTDLLVSICQALNADNYLALPSAARYLDSRKFDSNGLDLSFVHFRPRAYPQLWGDFRYNLSALDLLLNCGPKSLDIIARSV
ncbi:MAG: WbqC family protein [Gammaproteobacteria bacterium]|nr:WbqC family protein [Gammaproteobacteria bacterium]